MIRAISIASLATLGLAISAHAQADEDELVRLPGQGEIRSEGLREQAKATRLKPGAGLFITFDQDENGRISTSEIDAGIPIAFKKVTTVAPAIGSVTMSLIIAYLPLVNISRIFSEDHRTL